MNIKQFDSQHRIVHLDNLRAMCEHHSGMCHRYWIERVTPSRVTLGYSNPDEWGAARPVFARFPIVPLYPDTVCVLLSPLWVSGGAHESEENWQAFELVTNGPEMWLDPRDESWKTAAESKATQGESPTMLYHYTIEGQEFTLDEFTQGYLVCALWSSNDNTDEQGGEPLDANYDISDLALEAMQQAVEDCKAFQADNVLDLEEAYGLYSRNDTTPQAHAGVDFWLTRNGHGAGFWDGDLEDVGERLSEASRKCGEVNLYVGDDGKIYS